jgi:4-amino-4-deoxy-L-arabinose transferase-like glycosyltransferase
MGKILDNLLNKTLDIFFSKNKTKLYLLFIFLAGFFLRVINVLNSWTNVDASGHALMAFNFIESGKLATWNQSVGLWHFLTDLSYKLFGIGDFGARFVALIFGSLSIILIFLFTKEMFNEKVGLISALLLAFSPFHITETIPEMDVAVMFFILFGMLLFIKAIKQEKKALFLMAGIIFGTGILIKIYAVLFAPALIIYYYYYSRKNSIPFKKISKNTFLFLLPIFFFCLVPLSYNYLLYKDKGFMDYIFTNTLNLGKEKSDKYYSWVVPYRHNYLAFFIGGTIDGKKEIPFSILYINAVLKSDAIIIVFGLLGILFALRRKEKDYIIIFLAMFFTAYVYMGSIVYLMTKHYMFLLIFFTPLSALAIHEIINQFKKIDVRILVLIIILFQLFWIYSMTGGDYYEKHPANKLIDYKKENIPDNSLVVYDARIFRGMGTFFFMDKHYLESSYLSQLANSQGQFPGQPQPTDTYFIECAKDDCGWGTIKDQPEFNKSVEGTVDFFKANSDVQENIYDSSGEKEFIIYRTNLMMKPQTLEIADSTHLFWANPVGYDESIAPVFDNYKTYTSLDKLIDKIAHWIFYFSVFSSISSIFLLLYLFIHEDEKNE